MSERLDAVLCWLRLNMLKRGGGLGNRRWYLSRLGVTNNAAIRFLSRPIGRFSGWKISSVESIICLRDFRVARLMHQIPQKTFKIKRMTASEMIAIIGPVTRLLVAALLVGSGREV